MFEYVFSWFIVACLSYLIANGLISGSVWVKGRSAGKKFGEEWANKKSRVDTPTDYWAFMFLYSILLAWMIYMIYK